MTRTEAHELLNAAQAGLEVCQQSITAALLVTGDLAPCQRKLQEVVEVTHAVPEFEPGDPSPIKGPRPVVVIPALPKIVHKPFEVIA